MSKVTRAATEAKKIYHPNVIKKILRIGTVNSGLPMGPILGQYGLPIDKFVEDFNKLTSNLKVGVPTATRIYVEGRDFKIKVMEPQTSYLIRQAAGIKKGRRGDEQGIVGKITHKHVYEIAKVKVEQENIKIRRVSLKEMCESVALTAHKMGVEVVRYLDAAEYDAYLKERERITEEYWQKKEEEMLELRKKMEKKEAKLGRQLAKT